MRIKTPVKWTRRSFFCYVFKYCMAGYSVLVHVKNESSDKYRLDFLCIDSNIHILSYSSSKDCSCRLDLTHPPFRYTCPSDRDSWRFEIMLLETWLEFSGEPRVHMWASNTTLRELLLMHHTARPSLAFARMGSECPGRATVSAK